MIFVIHMIHSKLEEIKKGIIGKDITANVDIPIKGCAKGDCGERLGATGWFTTNIRIQNCGCKALHYVIGRQGRCSQVSTWQVADM